ncbi:hypothetical protein V2O64_19185 [Verrucomicrobiaceae bacterium 227]
MPHLDKSVSAEVRQFSFWVANRTVGHPLLEGIDYSCIFEEPSALEQVYAIYMNVLEVDDAGKVIDAKQAQHRAAQYIRAYVQGEDYVVDPPFEDWEVALHVPWE